MADADLARLDACLGELGLLPAPLCFDAASPRHLFLVAKILSRSISREAVWATPNHLEQALHDALSAIAAKAKFLEPLHSVPLYAIAARSLTGMALALDTRPDLELPLKAIYDTLSLNVSLLALYGGCLGFLELVSD